VSEPVLNPTGSPFLVFTVITAPAILTNVSALMSLTTSNRLARAVDRSRDILKELAAAGGVAEPERARKVHQIELLRQRAALLVRALGAYQFAGGSLAASTLVALVGAMLHFLGLFWPEAAALVLAMICATVGVGGIATGAYRVVHEARLGYVQLREDTADVLESLRSPIHLPEAVPRDRMLG
jgi:hypothetical protein